MGSDKLIIDYLKW